MKSFSFVSFFVGVAATLLSVALLLTITSKLNDDPYSGFDFPPGHHDAGFVENTFKKAGAVHSAGGSYMSSFTGAPNEVWFINRDSNPKTYSYGDYTKPKIVAIDLKKQAVLGQIDMLSDTDLKNIDFLVFTPKRIYQYNWTGARGLYYDREINLEKD